MSSGLTLFDQVNSPERQKDYYVNIGNEFVEARMDWSIMMYRIFMVLVSQIDSKNDEGFHRQYVRVQHIMEMAGNSGKSQYEYAQQAVKRLVRQPVEFETDDGTWIGVPIFSDLRYMRHKGLISALFHDKARPYLLELERQFTSWKLKQTISLTSSYAVRLYMIAKMIERRGEARSQVLSVDSLRTRMKMEGKYSRFTDFRRRVIDPSVEQINEECDLRVVYDTVRNGQTPVGVELTVIPAPDREHRNTTPAPQPNVEPHEKWASSLPPDEMKDVMQRAEQMARAQGYDKKNNHSWKVGVDVALRQIYREAKDKE